MRGNYRQGVDQIFHDIREGKKTESLLELAKGNGAKYTAALENLRKLSMYEAEKTDNENDRTTAAAIVMLTLAWVFGVGVAALVGTLITLSVSRLMAELRHKADTLGASSEELSNVSTQMSANAEETAAQSTALPRPVNRFLRTSQ